MACFTLQMTVKVSMSFTPQQVSHATAYVDCELIAQGYCLDERYVPSWMLF